MTSQLGWRIALSGILLSAALVAGAPAAELYVGDIDTDDVSTVDSLTASAALVGNLGEDLSFGGFAYDSSTSTMYLSDITLPPAEGEGSGWGLARVDLATGAATIIGGHVNSNNIWGLAYDSANDVLYGADGSNEGLATIDRATGESTLIGPYDPENSIYICGLAYDAGADTVYGVSAYSQVIGALPRPRGNGLTGEPGEGVVDPSALFVLDRATGAATYVGSLGVTLDPDDVRCGLEIEPGTGELIAGAYDGTLYRVDKVDGTATLIGDSGLAIDALGALPGAASPLAIPALSSVGLAILAGGLGLLALVALGRRRARLNGA